MSTLSGEARISPDGGQPWHEEASAAHHGAGDTGGYVFDSPSDKEEIKMQRQAIWELLKSLGAHLLREGINLTKVSLPVKVFEPRSFLERVTDNFSYLGLLAAAADAPDPVLRMQYLVGFVIGGLRRQTSTLKPFNPILGETFEGEYSCGARVFAEQISHHPPVSAWQVADVHGKFLFNGSGNWRASARGNAIRGQQSGRNAVCFASDGAIVSWELPALLLQGILWGERSLKYSGTMAFVDSQNNLRCEVSIDGSNQPGYISSFWRPRKQKLDQLQGALKKGDHTVSTVHGSWLTSVAWGGAAGKENGSTVVWEAAKTPVHTPKPVTEALPSDSRHRHDLHALKEGDMAGAQEWKGKMEIAQRADAALRAASRAQAVKA